MYEPTHWDKEGLVVNPEDGWKKIKRIVECGRNEEFLEVDTEVLSQPKKREPKCSKSAKPKTRKRMAEEQDE